MSASINIRPLRPEDHVQYRGIRNLVLWGTDDVREQMKDPLAHAVCNDNVYIGAFDEGSILQSAMAVEPYTIRMNGQDVKMGGIASVVTRPEARGMGIIRKIFDAAFRIMLENGQTFSYLFPFSHRYYHKFGYEVCSFNNHATIPVNQFGAYPFPKNFKQHEPDDDIAPFMEIYRTFTTSRNLSFVRDEKAWQNMLNRDPYKNHEFTYLNRDENGNANAYVLYCPVNKEGAAGAPWHRVSIKELCWTTPSGLHDIFGFFAKLSPEYDSVEWKLPCDINVHALFPDVASIGYTRNGGGMNRILDVVSALSTLSAPCGSGNLNLQITDAFWPGNSGTYTVEWEGSKLAACKTNSSNVDMATGIETLTQLVTGSLTTEECIYKKDTKIYSNHAQLLNLFPKQKLHMTEAF